MMRVYNGRVYGWTHDEREPVRAWRQEAARSLRLSRERRPARRRAVRDWPLWMRLGAFGLVILAACAVVVIVGVLGLLR